MRVAPAEKRGSLKIKHIDNAEKIIMIIALLKIITVLTKTRK